MDSLGKLTGVAVYILHFYYFNYLDNLLKTDVFCPIENIHLKLSNFLHSIPLY